MERRSEMKGALGILLVEGWPALAAALGTGGLSAASAPNLSLLFGRGTALPIGRLPGLAGAPSPAAPAAGLEYILTVLHGLPYRAGAGLASLLKQVDLPALGGNDAWRVDPVILRDAPGRIYLTDPEPRLPGALAAALAAEIEAWFGEHGLELHTVLDDGSIRGYLSAPAAAWNLPPPGSMLGADLGDVWPEEPAARRWRTLFNEMQMRLHQHPALAARRAAGKPVPNALWWWGGGALPSPPRRAYRLSGTVPPLARALSDAALKTGGVLHGVLTCWRPVPDTPPAAQLAELDKRAACTLAELKRRRVGGIALVLDDGRCWHYTPFSRWRLFRPARLALR